MALPDHLRIEPRSAWRLRLLLRIGPSIAYLVLVGLVFTHLVASHDLPNFFVTTISLIILGLFAIAIALSLAIRRLRGFIELPAEREGRADFAASARRASVATATQLSRAA